MSKELFNQIRDREINTLSRKEKGEYLKGLRNYDLRFKRRNKR